MELGLLYAVVAAVLWGVYIFSLKRYFGDYPASLLTVLVYGFAVCWYLPVVAVTTPLRAFTALLDPTAAAVAVGTALLIAVALVVFLRALEDGDVSYVTPINKIVPVFVLPIEVLFLSARLSPVQVLGVLVATAAVYVANYRDGRLLDPLRRAARSRPARLALLSAAIFAVTDVGKRLALQEVGLPTTVWVLWLFVGIGAALLPRAVGQWAESPAAGDLASALPPFVAVGGVVAAAEHVTSLAFAAVPASIASPIINTQAIVAVVLGGVVLGERNFRIRLVAAVLAVVGVGLIAL